MRKRVHLDWPPLPSLTLSHKHLLCFLQNAPYWFDYSEVLEARGLGDSALWPTDATKASSFTVSSCRLVSPCPPLPKIREFTIRILEAGKQMVSESMHSRKLGLGQGEGSGGNKALCVQA